MTRQDTWQAMEMSSGRGYFSEMALGTKSEEGRTTRKYYDG